MSDEPKGSDDAKLPREPASPRQRPEQPTPGQSLKRDDGRLTLEMPAVTLSLPDGFDDPPEEAPAGAFPLELDTGELHVVSPLEPAQAPPATPAASLDLDLTSFDPPDIAPISVPPSERPSRDMIPEAGPFGRDLHTSDFSVVPEKEAVAMVHDAWTRDRMERRAPTPSIPVPAVSPPRPTRQLRAPRRTPGASPARSGDALQLVDVAKPSDSQQLDLAGDMAERYALGDFTGALAAAELLIGRDPEHAEAREYAEASRERLIALHLSRIGGLEQVPVVAVRGNDVQWLGLDHQASFLLSRIDGATKLEDLLDVSGMPRLDALKIVVELFETGAIRWK